MNQRKKIRLGDLLVENKIVSQEQLETALAEQKKTGRKLGRILIELGYIDEDSLVRFLSRQLGTTFVDLKRYDLDPEAARKIPELYARRYRAIGLEDKGGEMVVGMVDPTDIVAYDELSRVLKRPIKPAVVKDSDTLLRTFDTVYRRTEDINAFAEELDEELSEHEGEGAEAGEGISEAPVVKLIQSLFEDAVQIKASDIHIEPEQDLLRLRQRVDGVLQEQIMDEKRIAPALVRRLKLMAGLDISEQRLPQDGRFTAKVKGKNIDVRLSTMPVQFGESVVLRLLDQSYGPIGLEHLGMSLDLRRRFEHAVRSPHGMVLVTGPTGSGKTTTLYAALNRVNTPERKIITVEDPVEYRLARVNQVQVNEEVGLTFPRVLRSMLRQDPDVVLVGEMRDEATVEIGLRAAMTGHLVLSTLHTNDSISTVHRLLDMGAEGYIVASALRVVLAQRLVRRVCDTCVEEREPEAYHRAWLRHLLGPKVPQGTFRRGRGCAHCNHTGYRGRTGVFELLEMDERLQAALAQEDTSEFSRLARAQLGRRTIEGMAAALALQGRTTLEEAMRVASGGEEAWEEGAAGSLAAAGVSGGEDPGLRSGT